MRETPRAAAVGLLGALFLVSQVLVLRGFLLIFQGNECSLGIVLGNWFLLEALGSWLGGKWAAGRRRNPLAAFVAVQAGLSLLLPATLLSILGSRFLPGVSPWEALSLVRIAWVAFLLLTPLALGNGVAFALACRLLAPVHGRGVRAAGQAYTLESLGAFLGGLAYTFFLVSRFSPMGVVFLLGALNLGSALLLLHTAGAARPGMPAGNGSSDRLPQGCRAVVLLLFLFFLAGSLSPLADGIQRWGMKIRWRPFEVLRSEESVYGNITVLETGGERIFYLNGIPSLSLPYPDATALEELVHLPLLALPMPAEVLFVGGGVGGALAEAQKHPLRRIWYAELDPLLIRTVRDVAPGEARRELDEARTRVIYEDGRSFLRRTDRRFDAILNHLPDASTLQLNRFFTREFFALARDHLHPQGILALSAPGSSSYLSEDLRRLNRCMWDTLREVFPRVRILPGERNLFLASPEADLEAIDAAVLEARLAERQLQTVVLGSAHLRYKLDRERERWLRGELESLPGGRINRDFLPSLVYDFLSWKSAEVQPFLRRPVSFFEGVSLAGVLAGMAVLNLTVLFGAVLAKRTRRIALPYSIAGSGFAGMAVELAVILAFQSVHGYLYQWIGLLIAVFMGGLALGSWLVVRFLDGRRGGYRFLVLAEFALTGLLLLGAWALPAVQESLFRRTDLAWVPQVVFLAFNLLAGLLVGSEFPLASREVASASGRAIPEIAGRLYALDLAGAWLGTFLVSLLLIPLLGIGSTLAAAAALKGWCLIFLLPGDPGDHRA